ncbi:hypothetical protein ACFXHA_05660 [Nocardia sp. NPDC059240]|uniref:hypothetical protein n=1 Tax=Nocardia sp. NPDC059240 TaxID=3346786 RepID=UPI0036C6A0B3
MASRTGRSRNESVERVKARKRIRDSEETVKILREAADQVGAVFPQGRYLLASELHDDGVRIRRA